VTAFDVPSRIELIARVRDVLTNVLGESVRELSPDSPLSDTPGVTYDSITRVEMSVATVQEFELAIDMITPEGFTSISAIAELVGRTLRSKGRQP
jgi:acyl carrier protein